jgi:hypothetical protein
MKIKNWEIFPLSTLLCYSHLGVLEISIYRCARQSLARWERRIHVPLKVRSGTQRVELPPRECLTRKREASLVRREVTHDVKRRQQVRGPRDRASKVSTHGADGVGKLEGNITLAVLVRAEWPAGIQERGTRT